MCIRDSYDGSRHKNIIGPTKRKKVRLVDFGDTLTEILRNARKEQLKNRMQYGELYHKNYYREVRDKNRVYYEFYHLDGTENVPEDYKEISFVCLDVYKRQVFCIALQFQAKTIDVCIQHIFISKIWFFPNQFI